MKGILENMEVFQSNHTEYSGSNTIVAVSSSLSLVTTGLMIILYLSRSKLRQASRGYLVMINVCDFVSSLCFLFSSLKMPFSDNAIIQRIEVCLAKGYRGIGLFHPVLLFSKLLLGRMLLAARVIDFAFDHPKVFTCSMSSRIPGNELAKPANRLASSVCHNALAAAFRLVRVASPR